MPKHSKHFHFNINNIATLFYVDEVKKIRNTFPIISKNIKNTLKKTSQGVESN